MQAAGASRADGTATEDSERCYHPRMDRLLQLLVRSILIVICAAVVVGVGQVRDARAADDVPSSASILTDTRRAADWQLANLPEIARTGWMQGVLYSGVMALDGVSPGTGYRRAARQMGAANDWRLGRNPYSADNHCIAQTYLELYRMTLVLGMLKPTRSAFYRVVTEPSEGTLAFTSPDARNRWTWCDALFMAPPAWARLYSVTGGLRWRRFMVRNWWRTSDYLYDPEEHLFSRDSRFFTSLEPNGEKVFWGRGNGWVLAGLARVLQYLPSDDPGRARFIRQYTEMADAVAACQQTDGLWRASMLDPAAYPTEEASASALFCYALAWGVNQGLLDRAQFEPTIVAAWEGLTGCVTAEGRLTHVQPEGDRPVEFDADNSEKFGTGALLLAGSEMYRWALCRELDTVTLEYADTTGRRRTGVAVRVDVAELQKALPDVDVAAIRVMDAATSRFVSHTLIDGRVVFRIGLLPYERRSYIVFLSPTPPSLLPLALRP